MKISEVEARVGVAKRTSAFTRRRALSPPAQQRERLSGVRDRGGGTAQADQAAAKLGVPLEEIRRMQSGAHTVGDGMRRHLVTLERERQNLERSMGCAAP